MKFIPSVTINQYHANESCLGSFLEHHKIFMDPENEWTFYEWFHDLSIGERTTLVNTFKPIFRLSSMFSGHATDGGVAHHMNMANMMMTYMEDHAVNLVDATELGQAKNSIVSIINNIGVNESNVKIYYGGYEDFKKYFLSSDLINEAPIAAGWSTNAEFLTGPIVQIPFRQFALGDYFHAGWVDSDADSKPRYHFPALDGSNDFFMSFTDLQSFMNIPAIEHVWSFLKFTHHIIELGDVTLLIEREVGITFLDLNDYIALLEAIEPIEALSSDIAANRDLYIYLLKHLHQSVMYRCTEMRHELINISGKAARQQVDELNNKIEEYSTKAVKEVSNNHGW